MTKPRNRPYGSGASTLALRKRTNNPGFILLIGRKLWQDIGMPERVILSGAEGKWLLEATADPAAGYRVSGAAQNTIPRCSIGAPMAGSLGLDVGEYTAQTYPLRKQILFWK